VEHLPYYFCPLEIFLETGVQIQGNPAFTIMKRSERRVRIKQYAAPCKNNSMMKIISSKI
jgi:hypothetical protein